MQKQTQQINIQEYNISSFCAMDNVLGKILQELLQKEGSPSVKDFAKMMGLSSRTAYNIFDGTSSMTFDQVIKASDLLNFNMVEEYNSRTGRTEPSGNLAEPREQYRDKKNQITVTLTVTASLSAYESFPTFLSKVRSNAKDLGFELI
jgi:plasmid maintenance system antidote protein VapI